MEAAIGRAISGEPPFNGIDAGKRRRLIFEPHEKPVKVYTPVPCPDHNAFGIVPHFAGEPAITRQAPDRRAKANALHKPADADRPPFRRQNVRGNGHRRHHMLRILK